VNDLSSRFAAPASSLTAELVAIIRAKPVTQSDLEAAALFALDAVANSLAGRNSAPGRILLSWAGDNAGSNTTPDAGRMAFLLGALCHILETDDLHRESVVHPGCVVVPAAWALAAKHRCGGKEFLTAILHGFEAATRVGMAVGPAHYRIWHNTATCGPFGSAMAAASLLSLDDDAAVHALGNAGSQSSGLWQFLETGAMTKHLHAGHAAEAGVKAAELAALGFTGPAKILEGEKGFFRATCTDADPDAVTRDPSAPWQLVRTSIKPWPSCRHTHPTIDAGEELKARMTRDGVSAEGIEGIDVETYRAALDVCDRPVATSDYEAKFSLQHSISATLLCPIVDFDAFGEQARAACGELAGRVKVQLAEPWASAYPSSWGGRVTVRLRDGRSYTAEREHAKGDPEAPLTRDEMVDKALMLLRHGGAQNPERMVEEILSMASGGMPPSLVVG
jgi:2-methylcitrate dehydratase PrpD